MSKHFTIEELSCHCGCGGIPKPEFVEWLERLREEVGFALQLSSCYRCPAHNRKVSLTGANGPHTTGLAADILVSNAKYIALFLAGARLGATGFGSSQKGKIVDRFLHLDIIPLGEKINSRPAAWSY